jgi:hypothetical protein
MPVTRRYTPEHPPGENCSFGIDMSFVIPVGASIESGTLAIQTNTANPVDASADWTIGAVQVRGRAVYAMLAGGVSGTDYQLVWTVLDTQGNTWVRTCLVLCAPTS